MLRQFMPQKCSDKTRTCFGASSSSCDKSYPRMRPSLFQIDLLLSKISPYLRCEGDYCTSVNYEWTSGNSTLKLAHLCNGARGEDGSTRLLIEFWLTLLFRNRSLSSGGRSLSFLECHQALYGDSKRHWAKTSNLRVEKEYFRGDRIFVAQ